MWCARALIPPNIKPLQLYIWADFKILGGGALYLGRNQTFLGGQSKFFRVSNAVKYQHSVAYFLFPPNAIVVQTEEFCWNIALSFLDDTIGRCDIGGRVVSYLGGKTIPLNSFIFEVVTFEGSSAILQLGTLHIAMGIAVQPIGWQRMQAVETTRGFPPRGTGGGSGWALPTSARNTAESGLAVHQRPPSAPGGGVRSVHGVAMPPPPRQGHFDAVHTTACHPGQRLLVSGGGDGTAQGGLGPLNT